MQKRAFVFISLIACTLFVVPIVAGAQVAVGISVRVGPPALPVYVQPPCPEPGYIWTPGYWAWGPEGYYWVPGVWVAPPAVGLLWTPGYWGWAGGVYVWHVGYWGPHVGFYGGINYGFGYPGVGFVGGYWRGGGFFYNRAVANVDVTVIHNTYINNTVINRTTVINHVSYNGGRGGVVAQPNRFERQYAGERHFEATSLQGQHEHMASTNRALLASANHGRPSIAATSRAGEFSGRNVVAARQVNTNYRNNNYNRGNNNTRNYNDRSFSSQNGRNNGSKDNYAKSNNGGPRYGSGSERGGSSRESQREREHR